VILRGLVCSLWQQLVQPVAGGEEQSAVFDRCCYVSCSDVSCVLPVGVQPVPGCMQLAPQQLT
jgi:hypothetical protein